MSQKRQQEDGKAQAEGRSPEDKRRRIPTWKNMVQEVIKRQAVKDMLEPVLEPLIRRVVREEVELALRKHLTNMKRKSEKETECFEPRSLQLHFLNNLSLPLFTGARIAGEGCFTLKVALTESLTGQTVTSGPESSAKVEIVVLEGDFDGDVGDNWTTEEFGNNIVREREGKKPLLTGDAFLGLKEGIGTVNEISFTDNSSWTRSRRFRLGARMVECFDGIKVKEAKTKSFIVRDHRGELYKKHHPPSLCDEVWRLEKIGKDGAFHRRLSRENIKTVKDFLSLLSIDSTKLRHILGTGMSAKMWEVTVEHARTCVLDKKTFLYYLPGSQQKSGVVFNVVGEVTGLISECHYAPIAKLSETEKTDAQKVVLSAFENWEAVICYDDENSLIGRFPHQTCNASYTSSAPETQVNGSMVLSSSYKNGGFDCGQPSPSSTDIIASIYSGEGVSRLDEYTLHGIENMDLRYNQTLSFADQVTNSVMCDTEFMTQVFSDDDHLGFFNTDLPTQNLGLESHADLQSIVDPFLLQPTTTVAVAKAQKRWAKLSSVLKCMRKFIASKKTRVREIQRY